MRCHGWLRNSRHIAMCGALLGLGSVAGCAYGPSPAEVNAGVRTATALNAQAWSQYSAVIRAARQVRANGGFEDYGTHTLAAQPTGELFPCPSPITAPIRPASPGQYSPSQEYVITLTLSGGTNPDNGQPTQLPTAISDLELGLRHEGFGKFSIDPHDPGYHLAWRGSGRVEVSTFSYVVDGPPAGVYLLIVSRCGAFSPAALPGVVTMLRKMGPS